MDTFSTIRELGTALRTKQVSAVELAELSIARADQLDERLGTYISRFDETARAAAQAADAELAAGHDRGPLHGIPIGIKDVISTSEGPTTAESLILDPSWSDQGDAVVITRLREAGAVITGKTTTMEFACGMPDFDKPYPIPRNPWDLDRWAGGSSSGTGNGIAGGIFAGGLGTDTGGSIRGPATFCGISGHKPTFGLVPKSGCTTLGTSFDHVGPLAVSAWDCAAILSAIAGPHPSDHTTVTVDVPDYTSGLTGSLAGLRIGVGRADAFRRSDPDPHLERLFDAALAELAAAGAELVEVEIPLFEELMDVILISWAAEAFAYHRSDLQTRWNDYGSATRIAMVTGAMFSAGDLMRIDRVRQEGRRRVLGLFETVDALVTPSAIRGAPSISELQKDLSIVSIMLLAIWNTTGLPALSVPMGLGSEGTPIGLQVVTAPFEDQLTLRIGDALQSRTDHHLHRPSVAGDV